MITVSSASNVQHNMSTTCYLILTLQTYPSIFKVFPLLILQYYSFCFILLRSFYDRNRIIGMNFVSSFFPTYYCTKLLFYFTNISSFSVSPTLLVPNQLVGAPLGTDVTIDCLTEAYPRPISFWSYQESINMIFHGSKYHIVINEDGYKAHTKLTIRSLSRADYGNYKCITKNSLGEAEGSMRIYGNNIYVYLHNILIYVKNYILFQYYYSFYSRFTDNKIIDNLDV